MGDNEDHLRLLFGGNGEAVLVERSDAIAHRNAKPIYRDDASRRREIGIRERAQFIFDPCAGEEGRTEHPRIGTDWKGLAVVGEPACEGHELVGAILLRKATRVPERLAAVRAQPEPDLKQAQRL